MNGFRWGIVAVAALGLGLLLLSHRVHALGSLPYLLLLACPVMHLFHRHHGGQHRSTADTTVGKEHRT